MGSSGGDEVMFSGSHEDDFSPATVEIKIKTLDSLTYTLRVDKCVPVPALKEQIASVTGVVSEQQRLICRGKVLKDDQLLSAYHVEDGHTLHLVVRQPVPTSAESLPFDAETNPTSSAGHDRSSNVRPRVFVGTFNISDQGDGNLNLNQVLSAVLSSLVIGVTGRGSEGADFSEPQLERVSSRQHEGTTTNHSNPMNTASSQSQTATSVEAQQFPVVPDSLTTLSHHLSHLRREFDAAGVIGTNLQESDSVQHATAEQSGFPGPSSLADLMLSARQLLAEAAECISRLARQLEDQLNLTDPSLRMRFQRNTSISGALLQNLGALLLELGRTTTALQLGQTPADASVNAGPAVFVSPPGPNPLMVQPPVFQTASGFGAIPNGNAELRSGLSGGTLGTGFLPRNIDIRIRTGSLTPLTSLNQREQSEAQQSHGQTNSVVTDGANAFHSTATGASGAHSSVRESEVRVVPIRTVVAAVPAVIRTRSDSNFSSLGLIHPILARIQHGTSGNMNRARGHQASSANSSSGPDAELQPNPESVGHQHNIRFPRRNETHVGSSDSSVQRTGTNSALPHSGIGGDASNVQEAAPGMDDQGIFLSNMLRQIMPDISQNTGREPNTSSLERDSVGAQGSSDQAQTSDVGTTSRRRPAPPSLKRRKRE